MWIRRKKILIASLLITLVVLLLMAISAFFIVRDYFWDNAPKDNEICIKTRCMPSELFRRSASSYICSKEECVVSDFNISDSSEATCVAMDCITRGDKEKYRKADSKNVCLDTLCLKADAVVHLKAGGNCSSTDCIVSAGEMLKSIDHGVKPCVDFYQYACGSASKNNIPSAQKMYTVDKALNETLNAPVQPGDSNSLKKVKEVFKICIDESSTDLKDIRSLSGILKRSDIGDWPLVEPKLVSRSIGDWNLPELKVASHNCRSEFELRTAMLHMYGVETFFRLDVDFSEEDSTAFIKMSVAPPLFEGICSEGGREVKRKISEYTEMLTKIFQYLLKDATRVKRTVEGIKELDRQFCSITKMIKPNAEEAWRITLEQLAEKSSFDWKFWHSRISSEFDIDSRLKNAPFYVDGVHFYLEDILDLVERSNVWINYLSVKFMLSYMGFMERPLREIMMEYSSAFKDHTYYGMRPIAMMPRWKQCQKYLEKVMGIALIPTFISQMITPGVEREMEYLAELVKHSFKETFHRSSVLYEKEKKQIMKTITKFGVFLLYPGENETFYDEYYSNINHFENSNSFLETGMQVRLFHQKKIFEAVYRGAHDYDLELKVLLQNPFESHAFAAITENKTVIFIGGMHVADVKPDVPRYMNFATLGTMIALEYVIGSHLLSVKPGKDTFDSNSKAWISWPEYIRKHVLDQRQCYVNRYSTPAQANGDLVVQEMMANIQALKESLQAYRIYCEKYGHEPLLPIPNLKEQGGDEQLFFILYAQSLCSPQSSQQSDENEAFLPGAKKVNEVLRNLEDFADAFHCPADSPMNPSDKCGTVW